MPTITPESLARAYGVPVPEELATMLRVALELATDDDYVDPDMAITVLHPVTSFDIVGPAVQALGVDFTPWRPPPMPPEFLPFGALGADGVEYGFLVHAPELGRSDWPLAEFQLADPSIFGIADGFRASIERLASRALAYRAEHGSPRSAEGAAEDERIAALLGIAPSAAEARWDEHGSRPITPEVPSGWRYEPAPDGVGVLAPNEVFRPDGAPWSKDEALDASIAIASRDLDDGFPASALLRLNSAFAEHWTGYAYPGAFTRLVPLRVRAYEALGRPLHAENLKQNATP